MIDQEMIQFAGLIIGSAVNLLSLVGRAKRGPSAVQETTERRTSMISEQLTVHCDGTPVTTSRTTRTEVITRVSVTESGWIDDRRKQ